MVSANNLLTNNKYKFQHIEIAVVEKDESENVLVFSATFVKTALPGKLSPGLKEINQTLWREDSPKRPEGYWVLGGSENDGVATSYFVSDEWLNQTPKERQKQKEAEWGITR